MFVYMSVFAEIRWEFKTSPIPKWKLQHCSVWKVFLDENKKFYEYLFDVYMNLVQVLSLLNSHFI